MKTNDFIYCFFAIALLFAIALFFAIVFLFCNCSLYCNRSLFCYCSLFFAIVAFFDIASFFAAKPNPVKKFWKRYLFYNNYHCHWILDKVDIDIFLVAWNSIKMRCINTVFYVYWTKLSLFRLYYILLSTWAVLEYLP